VNFGYRHYDVQLSRWNVTDPANQYHSPYVYCGNNPVNIIDPDGAEAANTWLWNIVKAIKERKYSEMRSAQEAKMRQGYFNGYWIQSFDLNEKKAPKVFNFGELKAEKALEAVNDQAKEAHEPNTLVLEEVRIKIVDDVVIVASAILVCADPNVDLAEVGPNGVAATYVNGQTTDKDEAIENAINLSGNSENSVILLIHNPSDKTTAGMIKGFLGDSIESLDLKNGVTNETTDLTAKYMQIFASNYHYPDLIGHSQGALVIAVAARSVGDEVSNNFTLYTYGGAANERDLTANFKKQYHNVHLMDPVAQGFGMAPNAKNDNSVFYNNDYKSMIKSHEFDYYLEQQNWNRGGRWKLAKIIT